MTQLAQRQSLTTAAQTGLTAPVGSGATTMLTFEFGTISGGSLSAGIYTGASFALNGSAATRTVTLDASNNSLQGIRDAINAANVGVTASILNVGGTTPYRLGTDGAIASRTTGINATIKDLDRQRDVLDRRLAQIEARYRKQFTALDSLMSRMTATSSFLTQQLQQLQRLQSSSG